MSGGSTTTGGLERPDAAQQAFGDRLDLAQRFADILTTDGIERGLVGPREADRIWDRHLLNCAALAELIPSGQRIVDVGSGAGLPGLVLAIRRPDLRVDLVESLRRRTDFLTETVAALQLSGRVRVIRGRAEDTAVLTEVGSARWVTARAVAPIDRLVRWCLPLLEPGGQLLAMKGRSAVEELAEHADAIRRAGGRDARVAHCTVPGTTGSISVIVVRRADSQGKKGSS
ncbi:MAG: 16S rRNA (guanine(527)-N(7))-methyltransferase RsmG [Jatrophihabitantaceae bacterium]